MRNALLVLLLSSGCTSVLDAKTVVGPSGSRLDLPAGALTAPAELNIATATTGFPAPPSTAGSTVFALTPHGQTFALPVTVTLPAAAGQTRLLTAQPGGPWTAVPGARRVGETIVAEISHFSYFVTASASPVRAVIGDGWAVREIAVDDGGVKTVFEGTPLSNYVTSVAVDSQGRVYWLDNGTDSLTRVEADGSGTQVLYTAADAFSNPSGLTLDEPRGALYWVESGRIMKAQLDGGAVATFLPMSGNTYPTSVVVEPSGLFVFFTDEGTDTVNRIGADGSGRVVLHTAAGAFSNPRALAIDFNAGLMFWGEGFALVRAPLDGGTATTIDPGVTEATTVTGVALDLGAQQVYWTDNGTDALARANYDGSGKTRLYQSAPFDPGVMDGGSSTLNFTNPQGVALIP